MELWIDCHLGVNRRVVLATREGAYSCPATWEVRVQQVLVYFQ